jgi:hypothetical protein
MRVYQIQLREVIIITLFQQNESAHILNGF